MASRASRGVLRNHLFTLASSELLPAEFYDCVDPFSDIDLVLDDLEDWPRLAQAISESLPFSGFHRWDVVTSDHCTRPQNGSRQLARTGCC